MSETETRERPRVDPSTLARAKDVRHLKTTDLGDWKEGADPRIMKIIDDYFHQFIAPIRDPKITNGEETTQEVCPACGEGFTGLLASLGVGAGIEWGLAHGEGNCSKCRWPYRGHHFIYDPEELQSAEAAPGAAKPEPLLTIHNMFLAYHPDNVRGWTPPGKDD